jgi:hypothetical protein
MKSWITVIRLILGFPFIVTGLLIVGGELSEQIITLTYHTLEEGKLENFEKEA